VVLNFLLLCHFRAESLAAATAGETASSSLTTPPTTSPSPIEAKVAASRNDYSAILTPLPMPAPTKISSPLVPAKQTFNISDFEADTSSPFDNMELKTINEMEELAQVLQPSCTSDIQPKDTYEYSTNYYTQSNVSSNVLPVNNQVIDGIRAADTYGAYSNVSIPQNNCSQLSDPSYVKSQQTYSYPMQQQPQSNYYYPNQQSWMQADSTYHYTQPNFNSQNAYPTAVREYSPLNAGYVQTLPHSTPPDLNLRTRPKSVPDIIEVGTSS
jgi:hypothetical protein